MNDRPYVASSFMSVAINKAFRTLLSGQSKQRQELVSTAIPLEVQISVLPCRGGAHLLQRLFEPLGYEVHAKQHMLDEQFAAWGDSEYYTVTLKRTCPLKEFLNHLYVLIPVLDNDKHYYIADDEIEKLLRFGEGWLENHPEKEMISWRYLKFRHITNEALGRLANKDDILVNSHAKDASQKQEEQLENNISLNEQRIKTVIETLKVNNTKRVIDLGCGEGKLLKALLEDRFFESITGCDVSSHALERAKQYLRMEHLPSLQRQRISIMQTALTYKDKRLSGYDAATIIEVIEHLDLPRLDAFRRVLFECARPTVVIMTTPNAEYNVLFESLRGGTFRHADHRFEWTRKEFETWANQAAEEFGYHVSFEPIGETHAHYGAPTQMGVFVRHDG